MSEQTTQEMRYRLEIRQGADQQMNALVVKARELIDGLLVREKYPGQWNMGPTQMSNLLNVCCETGSVEVVIGYVQYQIGRDKGRKGRPESWAWQGFGEQLIEELQARRPEARALVSNAVRKTGHTAGDTEENHVWMLLVRQYVGHLRRYFTYKRPKKEE